MRALVPVSVRTEGEHDEGGNRIVVMRGPAADLHRRPAQPAALRLATRWTA